jgi:hypothetical protein
MTLEINKSKSKYMVTIIYYYWHIKKPNENKTKE